MIRVKQNATRDARNIANAAERKRSGIKAGALLSALIPQVIDLY